MWITMFDDDIRARAPCRLAEAIEEVADDAGVEKSEAIRRLLRLGLQDCDQLGTDAALRAGDQFELTDD